MSTERKQSRQVVQSTSEVGSDLIHLTRGDARPGDPLSPGVHLLARKHQVDAIVYWRWRGRAMHERPRLPTEDWTLFERTYQQHAVRNAVLESNLVEVVRSFRAGDVPVMFFKGPWLAFQAYPDSGTRFVGDIDLCVPESRYEDALRALAACGYQSTATLPKDGARALKQAHYRGQLRFTCDGKRTVELHFRMLNFGPPSLGEPWLWSSSKTLELGGETLRVPAPHAMLLHLLLHANQHGFAYLRHLYDVRYALSATREELDWDSFFELVSRHRCRTSAYFGLELARDLAGADVPADVLLELQPRRWRKELFRRVWRLKQARELRVPRRPQALEAPLFFLFELGGAWIKLRYVAALVVRNLARPLEARGVRQNAVAG